MCGAVARLIKAWRSLSTGERNGLGGMVTTIVALNATGWGLFARGSRPLAA
jgi:hypothetical protein